MEEGYKKKYEKVINRAKSAYGTGAYDDATMEFLVPELKESEDERIRTVLCDIVRDMPYMETELRAHGLSVEKTLAYLEKQKELPTNEEMLRTLRCEYEKGRADVIAEMEEQKAEWSEEDEKRIKQLIYDTEFIKAHYEKRKEKVGEEFNNALIMDCDEQIAWLKSLHPQKLDASKLENFDPVDVLYRIKSKWPMAWEKVVWEPSEEQLDALDRIIGYTRGTKLFYPQDMPVIHSLFNDLKKLKNGTR